MAIIAKDTKLKPGHKQTDIGAIPEDWEIKAVGEIADVKGGKRLPAGRTLSDNPTPYPYIRITDMFYGGVSLDEIKYVPIDVFPSIKNYRISKDDIFITVAGTLGIVGKVPLELNGANLTENADKITNISCDKDYLFHALISPRIQRTIESEKTVGAQPKLALNRIEKFRIALPTHKTEQRAISTALSDVDTLIESLDKLIAKKRDIKRATMQQLLTGKTRLSTFSKELQSAYKQTEVGMIPVDWEVHTLGDEIDQLVSGISVNSVDEEFHIYAHEQAILKTSAVLNGHFFPHENKKIAPRDIKRAKLNPRVDSIIISRMNTPDLVGECGYIDKDYDNLFLPDRLWMTRFKRESKINVKWLSYLLNLKEYKAKIKESATGTSNSMKNISKGSLLSINIPFPTHEEQNAIATILSDMDVEIAALEQRCNKTCALKRGMMQELLTGKTRLV